MQTINSRIINKENGVDDDKAEYGEKLLILKP